jgi:phosphinothricin acetyltransferase
MMALIAAARRLEYWKLIGRIFTSNVASRRLCKSCGFREVGIHQKHGKLKGRWLDIVIVEKLIHKNLT